MNAIADNFMRRAWLMVGLLWFVAFLNYLDRMILITMRSSIKASIPMTDAQFGLLTTIFLVAYGVLSPFGGFIADKFNRSRLIVFSLFAWSATTWLTAHATSFGELLFYRALMGISEAAYFPAAVALLMDYHRNETRSSANGIHLSGVMVGFILPGGPSASQAGMENVRQRKSIDEIKKMVEQSGYKGERIVMMHPTDQLIYHAFATVAVDAFRKIGLNIDDQLMDWGTIVQRRNNKEPLDKGGWSIFPAGAPGPEFVDPLLSNPMRSNGARAWIGWPDDPRIEAAHQAWIDAPTDAERRKLEADYQLAAFDSVPLIPLGQYLPHAAWRKDVSGMLQGSAPVFWNVAKG